MQNLYRLAYYHETLYGDKSSNDKQLLIRPVLQKKVEKQTWQVIET
jgi:hypothetical protein